MLIERPYQLDAARGLWRSLFLRDNKAVCLQAPTGAGKTIVGSFFVKQFLEHRSGDVLFFAHRREIVEQTADKMHKCGLSPGTIMDGKVYSPDRRVQVCSIDSFDSWVRRGKIEAPKAGLIIIDEAHRAMGNRYHQLAQFYFEQGAKLLGMTATPVRSDGVGLGQLFNDMVRTPDVPWMIENDYLVPVRYKVGIIPDLNGVKLSAGDYSASDLEAVMNQKMLIGDIVENWLRHAEGRPTMVFASGVKHSTHVMHAFNEAGISCEHIDAHTPLDIRDQVSQRLLTGETRVVTNAAVYVEGTDIPWISCVVFAQPSKSIGKYRQQGGRGMRPWDGKEDLLCLDHAGVVNAHGRLEMPLHWELVLGKEMVDKALSEREKQKVEFKCPACGTLFTGLACPSCAKAVEFKGKARAFLPAELVDLSQAEFDKLMKPNPKHKKVDPVDFYAQCLGYCDARGFNHRLAARIYREKFKEDPLFTNVKPVPMGKELKGWFAHKKIAESYAARKAAGA